MPVRDDDLTRALRDVAPPVDPSQAYERVVGKRARRRAVRRARLGALGLVAALVVVGSAVVLTRDETSTRVHTPVAKAPKKAALPTGWSRVQLETDEGYLRGPITVSYRGARALVSVAAYDRDGKGGFAFPPSRIVRFDPDTLEVVDRVDLRAEVIDVVDGPDGVRFALTRNPDPDGPVEAGMFLKRIAPDSTFTSYALPPETRAWGLSWHDGLGMVRIGGSGFLRFTADGVLDGAGGQIDSIAFALPPGFEQIPSGEQPPAQRHADDRTWITGTADGAPAVALVHDASTSPNLPPERVVSLVGGQDVSFGWVADDTVLATSGGELLRHRVG